MNYIRLLKLLGGCVLPMLCVLSVSYHLEMNARKASQPQLQIEVEEAGSLTNLEELSRLDIDLYAEDLRQIQRQVQKLSWVKDAAVRRIWPDRLYLSVKSRQALAFWGEKYILTADGVLVARSSLSETLFLPVVEAPAAYSAEAAGQLLRIAGELKEVGVEISWFSMKEWGEMSLIISSGQKVMLGSAQLTERLARLKQLMASGDATLRNASQIDLRYLSAVAVRSDNN